MFKLAPSILSADFSQLGKQVELIEKGGADLIHVDVMDGHFVPNISFGAAVMKSVEKCVSLNFDVHLMIENPDDYIEDFMTLRTEFITVHQEACTHLHRTIGHIKNLGAKAGVSLNPATPVSTLEEILDELDLVLIMSVNPGFGGQKFIPEAAKKIAVIRKMLDDRELTDVEIEVDGGVNTETAKICRDYGATVLVAGNAVFSSPDPKKTIELLRG